MRRLRPLVPCTGTNCAMNGEQPAWALLGATGLTGRMVLERAVARGLRPTLVGRDAARLRALAEPHGLAIAQADARNPVAVGEAVAGHRLLLNAAGPFTETCAAAATAALREGATYLDLGGEIGPLMELYARDAEAKARGVALVGGVGFGIAAADAVVAQVARALGGLDRVRIAVDAASAYATPAVAESTLAVLAQGGRMVRRGSIVRARLGATRWFEPLDGGGRKAFASAPLAELAAAHRAFRPDEAVAGVAMAPAQAFATSLIAPLMPLLLRVPAVRRQLANTGGHAGELDAGSAVSRVWVTGWHGSRCCAGQLRTGEGFAAAADFAVAAVIRALASKPPPGALTPSMAFGPDWLGGLATITL